MTTPETIKRRYGFTLLTRFVQLLCSAVTTFIVPRALGPVIFGNYSFLLNTAATVRNISELSTQHAFFTFSAKSEGSGPLTKLYGVWVLGQLLISFAFIGFCRWTGLISSFWLGQHLNQIVVVTLLEWLIFVALSLQQLGDSKGLTIYSQKVIAIAASLNALMLIALAATRHLNFSTYLTVLFLMNGGSCLAFGFFLFVRHHGMMWAGHMAPMVKAFVQRWWVYASPLIIYGFYGTFLAWIDNYLIQRLYGSQEQGYFAVSSQIAKAVLVFTTSAISIYWRELSFNAHAGNLSRASYIYLRFSRLLYFSTLVLSTWVCFNADFIIHRFVGARYLASIPILMVMAFYPLQQTFGQINTIAFLALEKTKSFRNIGIWVSIPGLVATYFLLAPPSARVPGLGMGAMGIALKMVAYGLFSVQFYEWTICRIFGISYVQLALQKLISLLTIGGLGYVILWICRKGMVTHWNMNAYVGTGAGSAFYFLAIALIILLRPGIAGLNKNDLTALMSLAKRWGRTAADSTMNPTA